MININDQKENDKFETKLNKLTIIYNFKSFEKGKYEGYNIYYFHSYKYLIK